MKKGFAHESRVSETVTWLTPPHIITALGSFDLDPCGHPKSDTAKNKIIWPDDGLLQEWSGSVWLNPPYGVGIHSWMDKLANHGNGIALVFARTDTNWFHSVAHRAGALLFLKNRINFIRDDGTIAKNAAAPSVFLSFGSDCSRRLLRSSLNGWRVKQGG